MFNGYFTYINHLLLHTLFIDRRLTEIKIMIIEPSYFVKICFYFHFLKFVLVYSLIKIKYICERVCHCDGDKNKIFVVPGSLPQLVRTPNILVFFMVK